MTEPTLDRQAFASLKEAIDALAREQAFRYDALGQLLAALPLSSWPPPLFPSAWTLLQVKAKALAAQGIDVQALPKPPDISPDVRFIGLHPEEGFALFFAPKKEIADAIKRTPSWEFVSDQPHWRIYPVQGTGRTVLELARTFDFQLAESVPDYAHTIDLNPPALVSRRIACGRGPRDGREGFDVYFPRSSEVRAQLNDILGRAFADYPQPRWWIPAEPYQASDLLLLALRHQFTIEEEALPRLEQLADQAEHLPPKPPLRRIEYDESGHCFWIYCPPDKDLNKEITEIPGTRFPSKDNPGRGWRVPVTGKALVALAAFIEAHQAFVCLPKVQAQVRQQRARLEHRAQAATAQTAQLRIEGLGGELRPRQLACVAYAQEVGFRVLVGDEVGVGKTPESLAVLHQQAAYPALIICPANGKYNWEYEVGRWLPGKTVRVLEETLLQPGDYDADVMIINYDLLQPRLEAMKAAFARRGGLQGIIADECFPSHTPVLTDQGPLPIGRIVEEQLPVSVLSYNVGNKRAEWKPIARYLKRSLQGSLIRVIHEYGELVCTPNHKIWTEEHGYVAAGALQSGTHLRMVQSTILHPQKGSEHCALLQEVVCSAGNQQRPKQERGDEQTIQQACYYQNLRTVWAVVPVPFSGRQEERSTPLLWKFVCGTLAEQPATAQDAVATHSQKGSDSEYRQEAPGCLTADDKVQSDEQRCNGRENETQKSWTDVPLSWRQWNAYPATAPVSASVESPDRISNSNSAGQGTISLSPIELQGGYRRPDSDGCNRGRWQNPPDETLEVPGSAQDFGFACTRVVRVEVYQPAGDGEPGAGGSRDHFVYNLEVADNHNYVVNGVLVSNCHYIKNRDAQRTQAALQLAEGVPVRLALTGTPVLNRPIELVPQLEFIGRLDSFGGFWQFVSRYCRARPASYGGWDFSGASNTEELNQLLKEICYIRRRKKDVMPELPPVEEQLVRVDIDNREEYQRAEQDTIAWLREQVAQDQEFLASLDGLDETMRKLAIAERAKSKEERARRALQLARIEALKQVCVRGKLKAIHEWIDSFLAGGEKLVVFAVHIELQQLLLEWYPSAARILGDMGAEARFANVRRFQEDPNCQLIVCALKAAKEVVTLTAASHVALLELLWTPADVDQPVGRVHRETQQASSVTLWYLLAAHTIEVTIAHLIEKKRKVVDSVTDGVRLDPEQTSVFQDLLKALTLGAEVEQKAPGSL